MPGQFVLYVEDDQDDREFLALAFSQFKPETKIDYAGNGLEALDYLDCIDKSGSPHPCVIILDLNMPLMDGKETWTKLKANPSFSNVPVMILTSSRNPRDKAYFADTGVAFITKPDSILHLDQIVRAVSQFCN